MKVSFHVVPDPPAGGNSTSDQANQNFDEIANHLDGRYIAASEAFWRIYDYPLYSNFPSVHRLPIHEEGQESVIFRRDDPTAVLQGAPYTQLKAWFAWNRKEGPDADLARTLLYPEFPEHFTWDPRLKQWKRRQQRSPIGRMYNVHPNQGELFYLRLLLNHVRGATSFEHLRTVDGNT